MKNIQKKQKKNKVLIIDGNNLLHRSYHQYKSMRGTKGSSSMIFGFPYILNSLINLHRPTKVYVVFDGGRDKRRLEILPTYKKRVHREDFDLENFLHQKEVVRDLITNMGIPYYSKKDYEADDFIYLLTRKHARTSQVVIVSTDKDFNQLVDKNISIWNPFINKRITHLNIEKEIGYPAYQTVDYLCMLGDKSDCIDGVKGIGEKRAKDFLLKFKSIHNYLNSNVPEKEQNIDRNYLRFMYDRNKELIDIPYFVRKHKIKLKDADFVKGKFNAKNIKLICSDYQITKIIQPKVLEAFESLYKITKGK